MHFFRCACYDVGMCFFLAPWWVNGLFYHCKIRSTTPSMAKSVLFYSMAIQNLIREVVFYGQEIIPALRYDNEILQMY